jgi:hypothetical protein
MPIAMFSEDSWQSTVSRHHLLLLALQCRKRQREILLIMRQQHVHETIPNIKRYWHKIATSVTYDLEAGVRGESTACVRLILQGPHRKQRFSAEWLIDNGTRDKNIDRQRDTECDGSDMCNTSVRKIWVPSYTNQIS